MSHRAGSSASFAARLALIGAVGFGLFGGTALADPTPVPIAANPPSVNIDMRIGSDGVMDVTETLNVPDGQNLVGITPLAVPNENRKMQQFDVSDIKPTGTAKAQVADQRLTISAAGGQSTVSYRVSGTTSPQDATPGMQQFTWVVTGGWNLDLLDFTATLSAPSSGFDSPICLYGGLGSRRLCSLVQTGNDGTVALRQQDLKQRNYVVLTVLLPADSVQSTATFRDIDPSAAKSAGIRTDELVAIALATAFALGTALFIIWSRRRDRDHGRVASPFEFPSDGQGDLVFASPSGILPGYLGLICKDGLDGVDVAATVLDLAVRNYLWVAEIAGPGGQIEWQISRRGPVDQLSPFERRVVDSLLPQGKETTVLTTLATESIPNLAAARDAAYSEAIHAGWLRRRPGAMDLLSKIGLGVAAIGIAVTLLLASIGQDSLVAAAAAIVGAAIVAAGQWLPERTRKGQDVASTVEGMRHRLSSLGLTALSPAAQQLIAERALAYEFGFGDLAAWFEKAAPSLGDSDWYQSAGAPRTTFSYNLTRFCVALGGAATEGLRTQR